MGHFGNLQPQWWYSHHRRDTRADSAVTFLTTLPPGSCPVVGNNEIYLMNSAAPTDSGFTGRVMLVRKAKVFANFPGILVVVGTSLRPKQWRFANLISTFGFETIT